MADKTERSTVQLIIDGERAKVSLKELGTAVRMTRKEFREMKEADDPKAYAEKEAALQRLNEEYKTSVARMNEIKKASFDLKNVWKEVAKGILGADAISMGLDIIKQGAIAVKDKIYDLSDSLADVGKAAGLSSSEVRKLNAELSNIDTRTKNKDLREIAQIGGKNGLSNVADLAGFTKSTDMINVALGDQFESVTELSESLINMRTIFSDIKSDNIGDDVLHIGNALNYLEAQGTASGKGIVDFASRMGGTLIPLGLTSGQILGLSATMEELSITSERGSTAVNTIFQKMLTDVDGFAKVAGMKSKDFAKLLNTDIFAAFNAFVAGAKKGGTQATEFAKILADTELAGSGASEVVLKLASNQQKLATHVAEGTQKLKEASGITDEFSKKNNNAAAIMDKFGKLADNVLESVALIGISAVEGFGKVFGMVDAVAAKLGDLNEQQAKIVKNESHLGELTKRYDELRKKTKLSVDEQKELNKIMASIVGIVPGAATGFDAYGNAIDISKSKVQQFISEQHEMLKVLRQTKIELLGNDLSKKQRAAADLQKSLNQGYTEKTVTTMGGTYQAKEWLTPEQINKMQAELGDLRSQIANNRGDALSNRRKNRGYGYEPVPVSPVALEPPKQTGGKVKSKEEIADEKKTKRDATAAQRKLDKENRDHANEQTKLIGFRSAQGEYEQKVKDEADKKAEKERKERKEYEDAENEFDYGRAEKEVQSNFNLTANTLDMAAATGEIKPEDANRAKLDAEEAYLAQMYLLKQTYGQDTSDLEQQLADVSIARAEQITATEKRNAELQKEAAYNLQMAKGEALEQGAAALKSFFKEHTVIYKALFAVEKAGAVAQIIVSAQKEIAGYWEAYSSIPTAGPIIAGGLSAATVARSAASIATIGKQVIDVAVPGREEGGYTDLSSLRTSSKPAGYVSQPTFFQQGARSFIAGEKYKEEYVVPFEMLQDPMIRAVTENMEQMRITGKRPGSSAGGSAGASGSGNMEALMMANINATKDLQKSLEEGRIGVNFNYKEFTRFKTYIDHIYKETSL